jgi:hypothetical protein
VSFSSLFPQTPYYVEVEYAGLLLRKSKAELMCACFKRTGWYARSAVPCFSGTRERPVCGPSCPNIEKMRGVL